MNCVILHRDVKGRPYRIQDFRDELLRLQVLKDLVSAGPHQTNHVWVLRLASLAAKQREKGFEAVESNTRTVRLTLKDGCTVDSLPYEIRLEGCKVLVVVPGRAPLCLRCRRTGHIRRDCRVPRCTDCHRYGHAAEDCVKIYASIARDRKSEDNTNYVMDDAEAEEAVGGSSPVTLPSTEPSGTPTPNDDGNPDAASFVRNPEEKSEAQVTPSDDTKERLPHEPAISGCGPSATKPGHPGVQNSEAGVEECQDTDMDSTLKRPRNPAPAPAATGGMAASGLPVPGIKKCRVVAKPRVPPDDRRRKDSLKVSDTSEDEDIASAMVKDRRFGLQPYIYDPSASSSSEGDGDGPDTPPPARRVGSANWCSCNGCRAMLTDYESLCCREVDRARELCQDQGVSCITKHPWFELYCLNRPVLDLAYVKMQYFCSLDAGNRTQEEKYRYTAYHQFTWWVHKRLGRGNRVVLPSCVVCRIRQEFPSTDGTYRGFKK
ncbi:P2X purinoceptor 7-like isoform X1 [Ixodes scapularis]